MLASELRETVERAVERRGAHLIDLVERGHQGRPVLEVFIDTESGVTTDLCAEVSREISISLDHTGLLLGPYRLDVSSPGIERPLIFPWQYRKHLHRKLKVTVRTPGGTEVQEGILVETSDSGVTLQVGKESTPVEIPFASILEARVPAPW
jgi:ribosome maturation factor RimP